MNQPGPSMKQTRNSSLNIYVNLLRVVQWSS